MALNFPANPNNGDTYDNFYWDAVAGIWRRQLTVTNLADLDSKPIDDLDDVQTSNPEEGEILIYRENTQLWEADKVDTIVPAPFPNIFMMMGA